MARSGSPQRPPMRDGVSPSVVCTPAGSWATLLDFFATHFTLVSREDWARRLAGGEVRDAQGNVAHAGQSVKAGQKFFYYRTLSEEPRVPSAHRILFQDAHLLVADKPHFLPVVPTGRYLHETLLVRLKAELGLEDLSPIHRIDRETAGLVLFSRDPRSRGLYQDLFRRRQVGKVYEAMAPYRPDLSFPLRRSSRLEEGGAVGAPFFKMREVPGKPNAETEFNLLDQRGNLALYQLSPSTGRKHQLRVHMAALGIPILNDLFYPTVRKGPNEADDVDKPLQLLAKRLSFTDPVTGQARAFESLLKLQALPDG